MKRKYKKYGAWILIAGLMASLLGGCQKNTSSSRNSQSQESQGQDQKDSAKGSQKAEEEPEEPKAKGRYRETLMELPEGAGEQSFIQLTRGEGGKLELYTAGRDSSGNLLDGYQYVYDNGNWQRTENWQGITAAKEKGLDLDYVEYGLDGQYYLGGFGEGYIYHLLRIEKDGTATELLEDVFKPQEGRDYGMIPPRFQVLENGDLLIYDYYEVFLYEPSGKKLASMPKDFSGTDSDSRGFYDNGEFVTMLNGNVVRYDLKTGAVTETINCDEVVGNRRGAELLLGDGEGGIYMVSEVGLSHLNKGGTMWEVLIDGSLNRMSMRSLVLVSFMAGENEDYYGVYSGEMGGAIQVCRYEYDPDMASVPPSVLTVYSLEDNSTVRQAAAQFQSSNPDVWVDVRTAVDGGGTVTEEMIQGLNTELLSGKGADILILDGLPMESYVEKGVLMDLKDMVGELESSGDIYNNLLDGFKEEDGCIYMVPCRIGFPMVLGQEKAIQAFSSIKAMAEYQGEKPLLAVENYNNLLRMVATLRYEELFMEGNTLADRDTLIWYLESVKAMGEASGTKTLFAEDEMSEHWVSNHVVPSGIVDSAINYDDGRCESGLVYMDGYGSLMVPAKVREQNPGTRMVQAGSVYIPTAIAGINRATANEELAKEFIRCLLSYDVQKEELYDGLPVNRKAFETLVETDRPVSSGVGAGDYHISAEYPSLEVRKEAAAMVDNLTIPALLDETVMKMISEGSQNYFDGKETVEQAADAILRKLSIYLAE